MASLGFAPGAQVTGGWNSDPSLFTTTVTAGADPAATGSNAAAVETFLSNWRTGTIPPSFNTDLPFATTDPSQAEHAEHRYLKRVGAAVAITIATIALLCVLAAIMCIITRRKRAQSRQILEEGELKDLSPQSSANLRVGRAQIPSPGPVQIQQTSLERHNSTYGSGLDYSAAAAEGEHQPAAPGFEVDNPADPPPPYQARASFAGGSSRLGQPMLSTRHGDAVSERSRNARSDTDNTSVISEMGAREVQTRQMV